VVSVKASEAVEERPVEVGLSDGRFTEIVSGLQEGEAVVLPASSGTPSPSGGGFGGRGGGGFFRQVPH
jgi:multidrug efflux pump subunit AcrA (membrane-fusion protein)